MRVFCTIVSRSHLCYAKALAESLLSSGNVEPLHVLVTDSNETNLNPGFGGIRVCEIKELNVRFPRPMLYYFTAFELCNALKPFFVRHLFSEGYPDVVYLDSDLFVTGSFCSVWNELHRWPLLLTPHLLEPAPLELKFVNEADIADLGIFNGGFSAWRNCAGSMKILDWMCSRFPIYGFSDRKAGMFVDQKLLPLLLQYFPTEIGVLRDPSLNIAYWNAHERMVRFDDGKYRIGADIVVFFHMSGYNLLRAGALCSYRSTKANEMILSKSPWFSSVLDSYRNLLSRHFEDDPDRTYGFGCLNGLTMSPALRRLYFRKASISRWDPEVGRIRVTDLLRRVKRRLFPYRGE